MKRFKGDSKEIQRKFKENIKKILRKYCVDLKKKWVNTAEVQQRYYRNEEYYE